MPGISECEMRGYGGGYGVRDRSCKGSLGAMLGDKSAGNRRSGGATKQSLDAWSGSARWIMLTKQIFVDHQSWNEGFNFVVSMNIDGTLRAQTALLKARLCFFASLLSIRDYRQCQ